jgi:DNA recombination protein RmuC
MNALYIGIGLVAGVAITLAWSLRRSQGQQLALAQARGELEGERLRAKLLEENLVSARAEHADALANLKVTFQNVSNDVLEHAVAKFGRDQHEIAELREKSLNEKIKPLADLLDEYKRGLIDFDKLHNETLGDVRRRAEELLEVQGRSLAETNRLNQLLGRSSERGRWGEMQLENVLRASGLREGVDFILQNTSTDDEQRAKRPDCVVLLGNGASIAVDAKFPFDAFEAATATDDGAEKRRLFEKHASDLRGHIKKLREKSYWEALTISPDFVVCFVPSDMALSMAQESDPELMRFAADMKVVVAGPSNLIAILWSVSHVIRQSAVIENYHEIESVASEIYERIRLVATPLDRMGRDLAAAVKSYNDLVASMESRLIVTARRVQRLSGGRSPKALPELKAVESGPNQRNATKWDDGRGLPDEASFIIEIGDDEIGEVDE